MSIIKYEQLLINKNNQGLEIDFTILFKLYIHTLHMYICITRVRDYLYIIF